MNRQFLSFMGIGLIYVCIPLFTVLSVYSHLMYEKEIEISSATGVYIFFILCFLFILGLILVKLPLWMKFVVFITTPIILFIEFIVCGMALMHFTGLPPQ